jgi:hypothetical protein
VSSPEESDQPSGTPSSSPPAAAPAVEPEATDALIPGEDVTAKIGKGSLIGHRLGDFQVLRKLGSGGMADVYIARQMSLARDVALKVLKSEYARDEDYVARFRREARAAAKLNHPNIVQVYDVGSAESKHYIAQELVDGVNLRQELSRTGWLDANEAIDVLVGVASALEVASEAGITHRDIKPENIMRSSRGVIKVADFGLARLGADAGESRVDLTQAGLTLGTPRYMSPEQVQGHVADVRSDLYSLGVTMYHLLTGRPPFEADDPLALAVMHLHETPVPMDRARGRRGNGQPDLPEWLIAVVSRLIKKLPKDRFQSPSELLDAVRNEASETSLRHFSMVGTAAATIRLQRVTDQARRNRHRRLLRIAAAILLPLACVAVTTGAVLNRPAKSVHDLLLPDEVPQAETVQEQYLIAVVRNDEAGWRAVGQYFSEPTETNRAYQSKSMLQLAQLFASVGKYREADVVLERLHRDQGVHRLHQAVALARRCQVLEKLGGGDRLTDLRQQLKTMYAGLQNDNSQIAEDFDAIIGEDERLQLGIGATGRET